MISVNVKIAAAVAMLVVLLTLTTALPVADSSEHPTTFTDDDEDASVSSDEGDGSNGGTIFGTPELLYHNTSANGTKNLYVIKAVVYEIGILTDSSDEDNSTSIETQERVDLTFFDAHSNSSHIDLGKIPLPIQTNISGQVLTGIAPVDIGAFSDPSQLLDTLPLTGTIVNITHSNTAYFQLTTQNVTGSDSSHLLGPSDLMRIPELARALPNIADGSQPIVSKFKDTHESTNYV